MLRVEANGHVSFEADDELWLAEHNINRILDTLNPAHPNTRLALLAVVREYGVAIDKAWSSEYSERTLKDAQNTTSVMLASIYAGMDLAGKEPDDEDH